MSAFAARKRGVLAGIADEETRDKSPKGGLDAPIVPLIHAINTHADYVTTSSCSGRIALFAGGAAAGGGSALAERRSAAAAGHWLMVQHGTCTVGEVQSALAALGDDEDVHFKVEPFVMHVECRSIDAAQELLQIAIRCGFRESGLSVGRRKCMLGIRTTANSLELPVAVRGAVVVSRAYLDVVVEGANRRFLSNAARTAVFQRVFETTMLRRRDEPVPLPPRWQQCRVDCGESGERLLERWGHTATSVGAGRVLVFGGFGGGGQERRANDIVLVRADPRDPAQITARRVATPTDDDVAPPSPRCFHTATRVAVGAERKPAVLVFGGRGGPSNALNDVHVLTLGIQWLSDDPAVADCDVAALAWRAPSVHGEAPPPRYRHSATALASGRAVLILGGRDAARVFADAWLLRIHSPTSVAWERVACVSSATPIPPLFSHSAVAQAGTVYVVGGFAAPDAAHVSSATWAISLRGLEQKQTQVDARGGGVETEGEAREGGAAVACSVLPLPSCSRGRASHAACVLGGRWLVVAGGLLDGSQPWVEKHRTEFFDMKSTEWLQLPSPSTTASSSSPRSALGGSDEEAASSAASIMVKHTLSVVGDGVLSLGGGAMCGTFEQCYSPAFRLSSVALTAWTRFLAATAVVGTEASAAASAAGPGRTRASSASAKAAAASPLLSRRRGTAERETAAATHALLIEPRFTKRLKMAMESDGVYDNRRKIAKSSEAGLMALPISAASVALVRRVVEGVESAGVEGESESESCCPALRSVCAELSVRLAAQMLPKSRWASSPSTSARASIRALLDARGFSADRAEAMVRTLPHRWERVGAAVMVPRETFAGAVWRSGNAAGLLDEIWPALASVFSARLVVRKARVDTGPKRESRCDLVWCAGVDATALADAETYVEVIQHGVRYTFDILRVMFSAGNVTERGRMGCVPAKGETVVDFFAGIGYFTVPLLARAGAAHVHALEWNPHSVEALRRNLVLNGVAERCTVYPGDNLVAAATLESVADRVCLGLLPDAERAYAAAVAALNHTRGGWMHVHGVIASTSAGREAWSRSLEARMGALAKERGFAWAPNVEVRHVEVVKQYAPHLDHCVADVRCGSE